MIFVPSDAAVLVLGEKLGPVTGQIATDMGRVQERTHAMVRDEIAAHLDLYTASAAELNMGAGCFVVPKTPEVRLNDGGTRGRRSTARASRSRRWMCRSRIRAGVPALVA